MLTLYFRLSAVIVWLDLKHARWTLKRVPLHDNYYTELFQHIKNRESELKFLNWQGLAWQGTAWLGMG